MGACAQPRLAPVWRKAALSALADAAERGANASDAWQQADVKKRHVSFLGVVKILEESLRYPP